MRSLRKQEWIRLFDAETGEFVIPRAIPEELMEEWDKAYFRGRGVPEANAQAPSRDWRHRVDAARKLLPVGADMPSTYTGSKRKEWHAQLQKRGWVGEQGVPQKPANGADETAPPTPPAVEDPRS